MSVAGTYKTVVKSPMGDQTGTLTVVPDGDTFSGSLVGSLGSSRRPLSRSRSSRSC